jgi:hypothetical protein
VSEPKSGTIHIVVALIGVVGSLAVAWMTTQAKFTQELDTRGSELVHLQAKLEAAETRLTQQQQDMDRKVAAVEEQLRKLNTQIEMARTAATSLINAGGTFFGKKQKD